MVDAEPEKLESGGTEVEAAASRTPAVSGTEVGVEDGMVVQVTVEALGKRTLVEPEPRI